MHINSIKIYSLKNIKRSQAVPILAHGGEYILPATVKPTKAQMKAVNALHKPKKPRATRAKKAKK